jgi:hypothetical protein
MVFADERGDDAPGVPDVMLMIGGGSMSTRRKRVFLWAPGDFVVNRKDDGGVVQPIWQGARRLFEITEPAYAGPPRGERYRVEVGASKESGEQLELRGIAVRGVEPANAQIELFAGVPELTVQTGVRGQSPHVNEVQWRRLPNGQCQDWTRRPPTAGDGLVEVLWRDPTANIRRDRRIVAILPEAAEVRVRASGSLGVAFHLVSMPGWTISLDEASLNTESSSDGVVVRFDAKPLRKLRLSLVNSGTQPIGVIARTRLKEGGFAKADGALFDARDHVMLDDLRGAVAFADGRDRVYLSTSSGDKAHFSFTDELPLWSLSEDILRLLSGGGDLDHTVTAEMSHADGRRLIIGRYAARVRIAHREVTIIDEPVPAENTVVRSLEWFAILHPATRELDRRSWAERAFQPSWTLPDDLEGPGLIVLREGRRVIGRPSLYVGNPPTDSKSFCCLQRAAIVEKPFARQTEIDEVLDRLSDPTSSAAADRSYLHSLVVALDGLPAAALNVLEHLAAKPAAQAALLASAYEETAQGAIWKLERELPFMWSLIPYNDWGRAFAAQRDELRLGLAAAGISEAETTALIDDTLSSRAQSLVNLEPMLSLPLFAAQVLPPPNMPCGSLASGAQDRLRRSADQAVAADSSRKQSIDPALASIFRAPESPVRELMPPAWPFDPSHWEGLDAACAAAASAAGRACLSPRQIQRIRAARAQEPMSFADLFQAAFLSLANDKPLNC